MSLTNPGRAGDGIWLELKSPFHFAQPNTGEEGERDNKSGGLGKSGDKSPIQTGSDGEAYAYLLNVLAPEHWSPATLDAEDFAERANLVLEHAERMDCKRYLTPKDIVEGSPNLNLAFVAQIFHQMWDLLMMIATKRNGVMMITTKTRGVR